MRWKKMILDAKWILSFEIDIFFIKQSKENHTSVHTCCYFEKRIISWRIVWSWNATSLIILKRPDSGFVDLSYSKTYEICVCNNVWYVLILGGKEISFDIHTALGLIYHLWYCCWHSH